MSISSRYIMESNLRLINQIERDLFKDAESAWKKMYSQYCKRHANLMHDTIMQFKYSGQVFKLEDDVMLRHGIKPLHQDLVPEFQELYSMFVTEVETEKRILQNMLSHAIRIAKFVEDLIEILPSILHVSINEAGFFQAEDKPYMTEAQVTEFHSMYKEHFSLFDLRKTIGAIS